MRIWMRKKSFKEESLQELEPKFKRRTNQEEHDIYKGRITRNMTNTKNPKRA